MKINFPKCHIRFVKQKLYHRSYRKSFTVTLSIYNTMLRAMLKDFQVVSCCHSLPIFLLPLNDFTLKAADITMIDEMIINFETKCMPLNYVVHWNIYLDSVFGINIRRTRTSISHAELYNFFHPL